MSCNPLLLLGTAFRRAAVAKNVVAALLFFSVVPFTFKTTVDEFCPTIFTIEPHRQVLIVQHDQVAGAHEPVP